MGEGTLMTTLSRSYHIAETACLRLSQFLPRVGLNADWNCDTWHLTQHFFLCQDEDGDDLENFRVVSRNFTDADDLGTDTGVHFRIHDGDTEALVRQVLAFRSTATKHN